MAASHSRGVTVVACPCTRPTGVRFLATRACRLWCMVLCRTVGRCRANACQSGARHSCARTARAQPFRPRREHVSALLQQRSKQQRVLVWPDRGGFSATPRGRHIGCRARWLAAARRAAMVQLSSGPANRLCIVAGMPLWRRECASASVCSDVPLAEIIAVGLICDSLLLVRQRKWLVTACSKYIRPYTFLKDLDEHFLDYIGFSR